MAKGAYWVFMSGNNGSGASSEYTSDVIDLTSPDVDRFSTRRTLVRTRLWVHGEQGVSGNNTELPGTWAAPGGAGGALDGMMAAVWAYADTAGHLADTIPATVFRPDYYPYPTDHPFTPHGPVLLEGIQPGPLVYVPPGEDPVDARLPGWRRHWTLPCGMSNSEARRKADPSSALGAHVAIGPTYETSNSVPVLWAFTVGLLVDWTDEV